MAQFDYTPLTVANATAGSGILASDHEKVFQNVNDLVKPPGCEVYRTSSLTGYTANTLITWQAERYDTNGMWSSGASVTIQKDGIYSVTFNAGISATATVTVMTGAIYRNAALSAHTYANVVSGNDSYTSVTSVYSCVAGDTFAAACDFVGGSNYAVLGSATAYARAQTRLSVNWIGKAS